MSLQTWIFRHNCKRSDTKRDAGLTTPETIERHNNLLYGSDKKWQILDVYRPKNLSGKLPVIVSVHGGGWVYGDKEVYQYYCMDLAQRGFVVVNFTYRLAPRFKYPAAVEDTNSVFHWIMKHADEYGMDTDNIFALGDSAGASNIGLYAAILTNSEYAKRYSFNPPKGLKLNAIGLNCGLYDMSGDDVVASMKDMFPRKGDSDERDMLTLLNHITKDYPPCHIFTASDDFLKNEPAALIKVLEENEIPYEYKLYGSEDNPLYHVFHCNIRSGDAKVANDNECAFFRKYMKGAV